jgi:hypothetical protein
MTLSPLLLGALIVLGVVILCVALWIAFRKPKITTLDYKLLSIMIPLEEEKKETDLVKELALSEQLMNSLLSMGSPFIFEASVQNVGQEIHFYVAVPSNRTEFVARQIQGLYLKSRVDEISDYSIFSPSGASAIAYLGLRDPYMLPVRTYSEAGVDTFSQILSNLSKLSEVGEGASIQIIARPAPLSAKKKILNAIESLKRGEKLSKVIKRSLISKDDFKKLIVDKKKDGEKDKIVDDDAVKALSAKIAKPLFYVNVRVVASGPDRDRAEDILLSVSSAYGGVTAPLRNEFKIIKPRRTKELLYKYSFREFDFPTAMTLNSEELTSIFHLPTASSAVARVEWLDAKESAPPENLPNSGIILGDSVFRGDRKPIRLTDEDRLRHLYIIGQTGTGKSVTMTNMMIQDMQDGNGFAAIDPHGELIEQLLERVPPHRAKDVIVFDPGDLSRPLGLNMLEYDFNKPEQKTFIVNEIQAIFNRLFAKETMGPMFEQYMRNTLLLLMGDMQNEPATLMEVPRVMSDPLFRARKLERATDPTVLDFWTKEASKTSGETSLANMTPYITTKFGNFTTNEYIRPIIGQSRSAFNFRKVMDEKKILLVNLSKGKIGDINAGLLGMIITTKILMAALSREDASKEERTPFYLYIDEFQNFTTDSIGTILSEARKYKLGLTLAHQFIAQLEDKIREAVFGNVGNMLVFRVGEPDTEQLEKILAPEFNARDLISIQNLNAVVKILIKGQPTRPFNAHIPFPRPGSAEVRSKLKELSRLSFGRDRAEVEDEIHTRLRT